MTTYILGGGPAGLALALGLADANAGPFVLLEAQSQPGGMAQTIAWSSYGHHDLGPHKLYSTDQTLTRRVADLLPEHQWITQPKISRIYMEGQILAYPPSPVSLMRWIGLRRSAHILWDYLRAPGGAGVHFEDNLIRRVGPTLYKTLFRPMALKIWGDPTCLDGQLARDRVQLPSLVDWARRQAGFHNADRFEARSFQYPRGGLQSLWTALVQRAVRGGSILLGHRVVRLDGDPRRVTGITARHGDQHISFPVGPDDFVFSTLPLRDMGNIFSGQDPSFIETVRAATPAHDLLLVFLKIKGPRGLRVLSENWIFVPDPTLSFHRVSETGGFDPDLVPEGSILCCEIMAGPHRPDSALTDAQQIARAVDGLRRMGYRFDVEDTRLIRLNASYPVATLESCALRNQTVSQLDRSENLRVVGRSGAFQYIGTLDAMDIGFGAARWRAGGCDPKLWDQERQRTSRYPIYD